MAGGALAHVHAHGPHVVHGLEGVAVGVAPVPPLDGGGVEGLAAGRGAEVVEGLCHSNARVIVSRGCWNVRSIQSHARAVPTLTWSALESVSSAMVFMNFGSSVEHEASSSSLLMLSLSLSYLWGDRTYETSIHRRRRFVATYSRTHQVAHLDLVRLLDAAGEGCARAGRRQGQGDQGEGERGGEELGHGWYWLRLLCVRGDECQQWLSIAKSFGLRPGRVGLARNISGMADGGGSCVREWPRVVAAWTARADPKGSHRSRPSPRLVWGVGPRPQGGGLQASAARSVSHTLCWWVFFVARSLAPQIFCPTATELAPSSSVQQRAKEQTFRGSMELLGGYGGYRGPKPPPADGNSDRDSVVGVDLAWLWPPHPPRRLGRLVALA